MTAPSAGGPALGSEPTRTVDLRGLKCPLPALKLRKLLERAEPGATFRVLCTDPMAQIDIPNTIRETGDVLLGQETDGRELRFEVRRRP